MLRKLGMALLGLWMMGGVAWASPFLVCDPTAEGVTDYEIEVNGVVQSATLEDLGAQVRIKHDLDELGVGSYEVRARAGNIWGWSAWSDPLNFTKVIPNPASGLGIER